MANEIGGSVVWNLDVDKQKLSAGLASAREQVSKFADEGEKRFSSMAQSMTASMKRAEQGSQMFAGGLVAVGAAIAGAAGLGIKTAGEFETLQTALETVTGSSEKATKAMDTIKKTAKDSPFFEVGTLAQFVQVMAASGQEIETAVQSGIKFGDVAAAFGKGNYEMSRMGNTLSQVMGKGKADIVDFKELVNAGWVSVRKDTAAAMNVSMAQFEEMVSAGEVGYDQISKAAEKFAGSAEKQSGNFVALWSRLKETISTTFADVVLNTGLFDQAKLAVAGLITAIESIKPEQIESVINFMVDNFPIIAGIIVGGLTPAFGLLAISIGTAMFNLLPFIAAGAALGFAVKLVIDALGGWQAAQEKISGALQVFVDAFNTHVRPAIESMFSQITTQLLPALSELWTAISPVLIPVLKFLATLLGGVVIASFRIVIEILKGVISWVTDTVRNFTNMINTFKALPGLISSALSGVKDAITRPFKDAYNTVQGIADGIKWALDKISPYHRNSPSLVDNVRSGVGDIIDEYKSLKSISLPSLSGLAPSLDYQPAFAASSYEPEVGGNTTSGGMNQYITFEEVNVNDRSDIDSLTRELGFMTSITPGVSI